MAALGYKFYLRVLKVSLKSERSERARAKVNESITATLLVVQRLYNFNPELSKNSSSHFFSKKR